MSFDEDINNFATKTNAKLEEVIRRTVIEVGKKLVYRTPVGNPTIWKTPKAPAGYVGGNARLNWQYRFGSIPQDHLKGTDPNGSVAIGRITSGVIASPVFGIHYIVNNAPHIRPLENGHSTQAPNGMVELTTIEFEDTIKDINNVLGP